MVMTNFKKIIRTELNEYNIQVYEKVTDPYKKEKSDPQIKDENNDKKESNVSYNTSFIKSLNPLLNTIKEYEDILNIKDLKEKISAIQKSISKCEDDLLFENLKKNDVFSKKITRNYTAIHNIKICNSNTFLKIYQPPDITFEAFLKEHQFDTEGEAVYDLFKINYGNIPFKEKIALWDKIPYSPKLTTSEEKKEKEVHILNLLKDKRINVPSWYCHGEVHGLDFILQEKVEGKQVDEWISKNPKNKKVIIKALVEQLAEIHYYLHKEGHKKNKSLNTDKYDYYLGMFKNNFLDKYFNPFFSSDEKLKNYKIEHSTNTLKKESWAKVSLDFTVKRRLIELFIPLAKEISNLETGVYIDANPANILVNNNNKVYNLDFENVKTMPFQFDLAIFAAVLGLSDEGQTEIINDYLKQKFKLEKKNISYQEIKGFHRGYNLVSLLRNLMLIGNMHRYILKYGDEQAVEYQKRYFQQVKGAMKRTLNSEYASKEDKEIVKRFENEYDKCEIVYQKINQNLSEAIPLS